MTAAAKSAPVFRALRAILQKHAGRLTVVDKSPEKFSLVGGKHPQHGTPLPVAWVAVGKNYVSFHHMGVYARPELLTGVSRRLRARMQGKSCFNFTAIDPALLAELEELTVRGFEVFRKAGFMP